MPATSNALNKSKELWDKNPDQRSRGGKDRKRGPVKPLRSRLTRGRRRGVTVASPRISNSEEALPAVRAWGSRARETPRVGALGSTAIVRIDDFGPKKVQ
ncbi:hypothetical protein NDU88_004560 [Pleurodeles waltl]|uniref:Uncharacterized protein n=1 Tax=Pleurodeles waltl TaxID=8319 RepID=A0AAV7UFL7_PLEWA|nr:hypothetical protein NDU88_004560 [Pleurodeles waltl]